MIGELVMDRFRLEERIGTGGMGTVYRAVDERLQRQVAIKEVMVGAPERIVREAQAAARLNHPGIVALFEFGIEEHRALLVSELVAGATLDELAREGELCDRDVAELGADACEALEHAHSRGVIHRDVKPQNVMVRDDDGAGRRAKLMDFGIASLAGTPTLTATGEVVGTLAYMSPEQAEGEAVGPESDAYSLALTLYECWAGENPVRHSSPAQTARALGSPLPPLATYRPDLPPGLCEAIDACLDPEPRRRMPLSHLHQALEGAIPNLDYTYAVPTPARAVPSGPERVGTHLRVVLAVAAGCMAIAALAGRPGLGLLAALLCLPPLAMATSTARAALPALAVALGALSAAGAYPAAVAALERTPVARFALGAIGWIWLLAASAALGIAPPAGLVDPPPSGWDSTIGATADALAAPVIDPSSLLGMAVFGAGAMTLGWVLAARHLAMAALGAIVWAAALAGVLSFVGNGGLDWAPLVVVASALVALALEHRARMPGEQPRDRGAREQAPPGRPAAAAEPAPNL